MSEAQPQTELAIPPPRGVRYLTVMYVLCTGFTVVAIGNLVLLGWEQGFALVASLLWLALVGWLIQSSIREEGGLGNYFVNRLADYSRQHFLRVQPPAGRADIICFGFTLRGQDYLVKQVPLAAISSLSYSAGQATHMSDRDMNDWHVVLWYQHPDGPQRKPFPGVRDEELYLIGPHQPKTEAAALCEQIVDLLTAHGLQFTPGKDDCEFNTPARRREC